MEKKIRVRYAPSPTGYLHIGGARSALFNYLFAKKYHGDFVFRSEDTDIERNIAGGEESQYNDLLWLGIIPDESPFYPVEKYAPYRQTERLDIYRKYADQLVKEGKAYYCYCSVEELEQSKEEQLNLGIKATKYNQHCLHLTEEQIEEYKKEGRVPCIRLKMKEKQNYVFQDLVRGKVSIPSEDLGGDFVIMKSNGIPTYNFAVVIDDYLMEITHVFRGEEHLSNTAKQLAIYEAFGWVAPLFGHMTIIINQNGKKLSKRDLNILQFMSQYRDLGYLPEAIVNFILLLGWTSKDNQEFFTIKEAMEVFDEKRLSSSPSMFDPTKMMWINSHYIKQMDDKTYFSFIKPFLDKIEGLKNKSEEELLEISLMFKGEISYGQQIQDLLSPIMIPSKELLEEEKERLNSDTSKKVLSSFASELEKVTDEELSSEVVKKLFKTIQAELGVKGKDLYMPVRLSLTGLSHGLEMFNIIKIIGKKECINRLKGK